MRRGRWFRVLCRRHCVRSTMHTSEPTIVATMMPFAHRVLTTRRTPAHSHLSSLTHAWPMCVCAAATTTAHSSHVEHTPASTRVRSARRRRWTDDLAGVLDQPRGAGVGSRGVRGARHAHRRAADAPRSDTTHSRRQRRTTQRGGAERERDHARRTRPFDDRSSPHQAQQPHLVVVGAWRAERERVQLVHCNDLHQA